MAKKTAEAEAAIAESDRLKAENNNLRNFSEHMMKHPAFQEFLKDMTNPLMKQAPAVQPPPRTVAPAAVEPSYNPMRDYNPNIASEEHQWPLAYGQWNNTSHVYNVQMPEDPVLDFDGKMGFEEDFTIADGFFSGIRNEKGTIDWDLMDEQNDDEVIYQPPENIEDLYIEQEAALKTRNLDELFPGVGVNSLLERLEMVASGEARAEDLFEITELPAVKAAPEKQLPSSSCGQEERTPSVCKSNRMLHEAEGVFRRIGLAVGGK